MRESGILMPIFSLPSDFGVGSFSKEAYDFVDFLEKSGQGFWQVLPLGPTGFGNSPYLPVSAFAGNAYLISPRTLIEEGYLTWDECNRYVFSEDREQVDYGALYNYRYKLLEHAFVRFNEKLKHDVELKEEYDAFVKAQEYWLKDYALFRVIKDSVNGKPWYEWEDDLKNRDKKALKKAEEEFAEEIAFVYFRQFMFDKQWMALREYANEHDVKIIGDMPFYVSLDSADVWADPKQFQMDEDLAPKVVAGCPPDAFSEKGQMWGNPIYDWKSMKKNDYSWWMKRIARNHDLFDVIRIDHFHGFCDYYAIPYGAEDATEGKKEKGPGIHFFDVMREKLGNIAMIAEDLGEVTAENEELLKESGIPGMQVLQYAFTSYDSKYLTYKHNPVSVVYTGTHDNMTVREWVETLNEGSRDYARRYINSRNSDYGGFTWDFIREAYRSASELCIVPLQDYLVKGKEARINTPGTMGANWQWRLQPNFLSEDLARSIRELAETYGRIPVKTKK